MKTKCELLCPGRGSRRQISGGTALGLLGSLRACQVKWGIRKEEREEEHKDSGQEGVCKWGTERHMWPEQRVWGIKLDGILCSVKEPAHRLWEREGAMESNEVYFVIWLLWGRYSGGDTSGHGESPEKAAPDVTTKVIAAHIEEAEGTWGKEEGSRRHWAIRLAQSHTDPSQVWSQLWKCPR